MDLRTIGQVSREYGVSARMLRYYEQVGLLKSLRKDDYAYRVYDCEQLNRLRQIIVLRKLRVPIKQITDILNNKDTAEIVEIFRQNISRIDEEITALSTVKEILTGFVTELNEKANININLLGGEALFSVINSLSFSDNKIIEKKESMTMENLNTASKKLTELTDRDVRIIYIPPSDVAAFQFEGDNPEEVVGEVIRKFVRESNLVNIKPDIRQFGFNAPNPMDETFNSHIDVYFCIKVFKNPVNTLFF